MSEKTNAVPDWIKPKGEQAAPASGWDAVDGEAVTDTETDAQFVALMAEYERAKLVFDVFTQGRGPELLEHLRDELLNVPLTRVHGVIGFDMIDFPLNPQEWAWIRTGENLVFHFIEAMIAKASQGPPKVAANTGD